MKHCYIDLLLNLFIAIVNVVITPTNTNNSCHGNTVICTDQQFCTDSEAVSDIVWDFEYNA